MLANLFAHGSICCRRLMRRFRAGNLLGIQMEKKMAPRPPSFMRGMSMLPLAERWPRSKLPSRKRCVVSSWVSTTMEEKWKIVGACGDAGLRGLRGHRAGAEEKSDSAIESDAGIECSRGILLLEWLTERLDFKYARSLHRGAV